MGAFVKGGRCLRLSPMLCRRLCIHSVHDDEAVLPVCVHLPFPFITLPTLNPCLVQNRETSLPKAQFTNQYTGIKILFRQLTDLVK